jgi:ATP-binding cassette, subfamily C (CFTR/MRP), member 1
MDNRLLALSQLNCSNDLDDRVGPAVDQCRRGFDLTLLFEQSILFLLPACIFLIATPARLVKLWRSQIKVSRNVLGFCKVVR